MVEGGCECGAVRFRFEVDPIFVNCCHCRQCQRLTGSAFALNAMIEADEIKMIGGVDRLAIDRGGTRCKACGVLLWALHPIFGEAIIFLRLGTLDEGELFPPDCHFFVRSRHPWVVLGAGIPAYETLPGDNDPPLLGPAALARVEAARARLAPPSGGR